MARQLRMSISDNAQQRNLPLLERLNQPQKFITPAAMTQRQHQILIPDTPQVSMERLRRMQKMAGRARRSQRAADFLPDLAGLANPCDNHRAAAGINPPGRLRKDSRFNQPRQPGNTRRLRLNHTPGKGQIRLNRIFLSR